MKNSEETRLLVSQMTCGSCVLHVTRALQDLKGVEDVQVSLREGEVRVVHDPQETNVGELIEALSQEGYPAKPFREASAEVPTRS